MRSPSLLVGALAPALIALFLFISHLGEPFGGRRLLLELLLGLPLIAYLSAAGARSKI